MAVVAARDARFERAATPLFRVATLLEPTGIIVMLREFSRGGDPAYGLLFMGTLAPRSRETQKVPVAASGLARPDPAQYRWRQTPGIAMTSHGCQ